MSQFLQSELQKPEVPPRCPLRAFRLAATARTPVRVTARASFVAHLQHTPFTQARHIQSLRVLTPSTRHAARESPAFRSGGAVTMRHLASEAACSAACHMRSASGTVLRAGRAPPLTDAPGERPRTRRTCMRVMSQNGTATAYCLFFIDHGVRARQHCSRHLEETFRTATPTYIRWIPKASNRRQH
jgi:hypothetical protein